MITTLSDGGASLGVDGRDGFMLAVEQSGADIEGGRRRRPAQARHRRPTRRRDDPERQGRRPDRRHLVEPGHRCRSRGDATGHKFYLSPNAGPSLLAGENRHENHFNVAWRNDNLHEAAGAYADSAGYAKSSILAPDYPAGKDAFTGYGRMYGGEIVNEVYTKPGATEYAAEIARIRASDADSVFFFLPGGMGFAVSFPVPDTTAGRDIVGMMEAKIPLGASVEFRGVKDRVDTTPGGKVMRTILGAELTGVGITPNPAYQGDDGGVARRRRNPSLVAVAASRQAVLDETGIRAALERFACGGPASAAYIVDPDDPAASIPNPDHDSTLAADGTFAAGTTGARIQGGLYEPDHAEAAGVFEQNDIAGAFGAKQQPWRRGLLPRAPACA